jgi:hypothetical protein
MLSSHEACRVWEDSEFTDPSVPNPAFFLVGFPGSGLSLLHQWLDGHRRLAVAPRLDWLSDYFTTRTGLNLEGLMTSELVAKWVEQKRFDIFGVSREAIDRLIPSGERLSYGSFLTRLWNFYRTVKGKELVGSKAPEYLCLLPTVHTLWPKARIVHLVRDGRDVYLAARDIQEIQRRAGRFATWAEDPASTLAVWWVREVDRGRNDGRLLGPRLYFEVRYEDMVTHPAKEMAKLCAFLGLADHDSVLGSREEPRPQDWRTQMAAGDIQRFEAAAGDLLTDLGYPLAAARPWPAVLHDAAQTRSSFAQAEARVSEARVRALARRRREVGGSNPFVFIVGCPRSGTTLVQRIVAAHPDVAICDETFWLPYFFKKRIGVTPEGLVTPELISRLLEYNKFYRMRIGRAELEAWIGSREPPSYAHFVQKIFDRVGEAQGKPLVGDKTPDYARNLPALHALWPNAKVVHLIRDGRNVCLSALTWKRKAAKLASLFSTWAEHPVATAAAWWEWHVRLGRQGGRQLRPDRYYEVRYESLVERPAEQTEKLCAFLGVPYAETMLRFHEGRTRADAGLDAKQAWLAITPGLRDWSTQMPAADLECFETMVGDLLEELGYPLVVARRSVCAREQAAAIRDSFVRDADSLGDWLP